MTEVHQLEPHDELPEDGRFVLVMRRFGEDAPTIALTEIIVVDDDPPPEVTVALRPDGNSMHFDEAVAAAVALAEERGVSVVYAVDRTGGPREAKFCRTAAIEPSVWRSWVTPQRVRAEPI
jgi:hypothetical protein